MRYITEGRFHCIFTFHNRNAMNNRLNSAEELFINAKVDKLN